MGIRDLASDCPQAAATDLNVCFRLDAKSEFLPEAEVVRRAAVDCCHSLHNGKR